MIVCFTALQDHRPDHLLVVRPAGRRTSVDTRRCALSRGKHSPTRGDESRAICDSLPSDTTAPAGGWSFVVPWPADGIPRNRRQNYPSAARSSVAASSACTPLANATMTRSASAASVRARPASYVQPRVRVAVGSCGPWRRARARAGRRDRSASRRRPRAPPSARLRAVRRRTRRPRRCRGTSRASDPGGGTSRGGAARSPPARGASAWTTGSSSSRSREPGSKAGVSWSTRHVRRPAANNGSKTASVRAHSSACSSSVSTIRPRSVTSDALAQVAREGVERGGVARERAVQLGREREAGGRQLRPALDGARGGERVERRVDLDAVEATRRGRGAARAAARPRDTTPARTSPRWRRRPGSSGGDRSHPVRGSSCLIP